MIRSDFISLTTNHKVIIGDSRKMDKINDASVDLIVTSPPYPLIEMWDNIFTEQNEQIGDALNDENGDLAFDLMHKELTKVWGECNRVLRQGSFACINIGNATRSIGGKFKLYDNHSQTLRTFRDLGFDILPFILWRKQTNKPNKFMGSGMYPAGAYITLEHEYILIFRKGDKREFKDGTEKENRHKSAFFWEERNNWFSDIWDFKGISQTANNGNSIRRSGAYPFELAFRLINMFSVKGDLVLDPFLGTGTSTHAAVASGRNSVGIEIDDNYSPIITSRFDDVIEQSNKYIEDRINNHLMFVTEREKTKGPLKYTNKFHKFPVMTRQEVELTLKKLDAVNKINGQEFEVSYKDE